MSRLLIVSNRLPVTVTTAQGRPTVTASAGGLATGMRGAFERTRGQWIGWPGSLGRLDEEVRKEVLAGLTDLRCVPVELTKARGAQLLRRVFQRGPVAPLSLSARSHPDALDRVGGVSTCQCKICRRGRRRVSARRHHLGPRLSPPVIARAAARAAAGRAHRVLPAHPVPRVGGVPPAAVAGRDPARADRRRPDRVSHARVRAQLLGGGRPPAGARAELRRAAGRRAEDPLRRVPDGHRRRGVRRPGRAARPPPAGRRAPAPRHRPPRLHQGHPPAPDGRRPRAAAPARPARQAAGHADRRAPRARRSTRTRSFAPASSRRSARSTAAGRPSTARPSTTCTADSRRPR
jgi:hypothetical protein